MLVIDNEENKRETVQGKYFKGNFLGGLKEKMPKKIIIKPRTLISYDVRSLGDCEMHFFIR